MYRWMVHTKEIQLRDQTQKLALSHARAERLVHEIRQLGNANVENANVIAERALNKKLLQRIHELEMKLQHDAANTLKLIDVADEGQVVQQLLAAKEQEAERYVAIAHLR